MGSHFPFPAESVLAPVSDAEFRTYVLLCTLAWQQHPEADPPYVEMTYAELAAQHPRPVAVATLRVRVMALVRHGFLRREQVGRSTWRTYVTGLAPLPPNDGSRKALSRQPVDRTGQPQMVVKQRTPGIERLMQAEADRSDSTPTAKPSAKSSEPDRPTITQPAKPATDNSEPDRSTITQGQLSASSSKLDRRDSSGHDRVTITLDSVSPASDSLSWGDMIRRGMDVTPSLEDDPDAVPMDKPPKDRVFNFDPILSRGRNRERFFFDTQTAGSRRRVTEGEGDREAITLGDSQKPDRSVITLDQHSADSPKPDRPVITLVEGDRLDHTLNTTEGDRVPIRLDKGDQLDNTLDAVEGDRPGSTHEPDHQTITLDGCEGDRHVITLEQGDRPDHTQTAEGDRPAHTLAGPGSPSRTRVRAHADQDQDQITDLTDPDLIKRPDLKNKKTDQDQIHRGQVRARVARPKADPAHMAAFNRTGNVVHMGDLADPDFSSSGQVGTGWEAFARTGWTDPDFGFPARTGGGKGRSAGVKRSDPDADFGFSFQSGGGQAGSSTLDGQAPSQKPPASRFGPSAPEPHDPVHPASKNPPLTAAPASIAAPKMPTSQASQEPASSPAPPLAAPQVSTAAPTTSTRQPAKKPSLKAAPSLTSILSNLDPSHHQLAHDLLSLKPEPMDLKGLAEVMVKPELTAAWFAWTTDPANGVRKPAAYLRSMVRKGYFPPPRPGDELETPVSTVDADGVDRSNPNYDVWYGGYAVGKGEIFDLATYVHPSRRDDLVWP